MSRKILHLDLDAFFCSVEEIFDPSLRGKPFIVGGSPEGRGVVASASYAARAFGIRSAMPAGRALRLCPDLLVVRGHYAAYHTSSEAVMDRLMALTPLVEQISIDEAFFDVSDLPQSGLEIARGIQRSIWDELSLPCSIGVAANKLVAKMATDAGKRSHRGQPGPPQTILRPARRRSRFSRPAAGRRPVGHRSQDRRAPAPPRRAYDRRSPPPGRKADG